MHLPRFVRRRAALLFSFFLLPWAAGGCQSEQESLSSTAQASQAALEVSPQFYVNPPSAIRKVIPQEFQGACGPRSCLSLFRLQNGAGGHSNLMGSLSDYNPEAGKPSQFFVSEKNNPLAVLAWGDQFLVALSPREEGWAGAVYYQIDGITGDSKEVQLPEALQGREWRAHVTTDDSLALLVPSSANIDNSELFLLEKDWSVRSLVPLAGFSSYGSLLIAGPDQLFVVKSSPQASAVRIQESTGQLLDETPILISKYEKDLISSEATGFYEKGNYVIVFGGFSRLRSFRIDAQTGEVLEKDDDFNEKSSPNLMYTLPTSLTVGGSLVGHGAGNMTHARLDGQSYVVYQAKDGSLFAVSVDAETGLRPEGAPAPLALGRLSNHQILRVADGPQFSLFHHESGSAVVVSDRNYRLQAAVTTGQAARPFQLNADTWNLPYSSTAPIYNPMLAYNGERYLVVYIEGDGETAGGLVYAVFVDPDQGPLPETRMLLGEYGETLEVASDGENFLVWWVNFDRVYYRTVSSQGVLGTTSSLLHRSGERTYLRAGGHDGSSYYVITSDRLARFDSRAREIRPRVEVLSADFVLVDQPAEPEKKTFLFVRNHGTSVSAQRMRAATNNLLSYTTVFPDHKGAQATTNGKTAVVVAQQNGQQSWDAVHVDYLTGLPIAETKKTILNLGENTWVSRVYLDGQALVVLMYSSGRLETGPAEPLFMRRFDYETFEPVDGYSGEGPGLPISTSPHSKAGQSARRAIAGAPGKSLVIAVASDLRRAGDAIHGYLIGGSSWTGEPVDGGSGGGSNSGSGGGNNSGAGGSSSGGGNNSGGAAHSGGSGGIPSSGSGGTDTSEPGGESSGGSEPGAGASSSQDKEPGETGSSEEESGGSEGGCTWAAAPAGGGGWAWLGLALPLAFRLRRRSLSH